MLIVLALKYNKNRREARNVRDLLELKRLAEEALKSEQEKARMLAEGRGNANLIDEGRLLRDREESGRQGWSEVWRSPKK